MIMDLLEILKAIKAGDRYERQGLCQNIIMQQKPGSGTMIKAAKLMDAWPKKHAGAADGYHVDGYDEYSFCRINGGFWENPRRLELLDWMIEQLEREEQDNLAVIDHIFGEAPQ